MKKAAMLILLSFAMASCSNGAADQKAEKIALPTAQNIPVGVNKDCECLENNSCAILEEQLGFFEVRNLSCKWDKSDKEAQCSLETRFVAQFPEQKGELKNYPGKWGKIEMTARHMGNDAWCEAAIKV